MIKTKLKYTILFIVAFWTCQICQCQKKQSDSSMSNQMLHKNKRTLTIGTYTKATSEGVYQVDFNTNTGELDNLRLVAKLEQPTFLTLSKNKEKMYATSEINKGRLSVLVKQEDGSYSVVQEISTKGSTTTHVILNKDESLISATNYREGSLAVFGQDGNTLSKKGWFKHQGSSVHPRQKEPHPHSSYFSKDEKYIYVSDMGTDEIISYPIVNGKPTNGKLALKMNSGDGPRHMASHPTKDLWFVVGELSNVVWSLKSKPDGTFKVIDKQNILPEKVEGRTTASDVHCSPNGKYLYTSSRGHKNGYHGISVFKIMASGSLKPLEYITEGINQPRNFCLSPDGRFLVVANQYGDNVMVFKVNQTGMLEPTEHSIDISMPACLKF